MACISKVRIGFIGSSLFIGWAFAAIFTPRLADIYGRRPIYLLSMSLQVVALLGLYFSKNINVTTGFMFVMGISSVGRCSISFLYLMDLLPANR